MVDVIFQKSGIPYGYGYGAGETGIVKPEDVAALMAAGVIQVIEKEKREKAVTGKPTEKR